MIRLSGIRKRLRSGDGMVEILRGIDLEVGRGESVAVVGPSGSGKSTLLGLIAGLDAPSEGRVTLGDVDLASLDEDGRARLRGERIGFVFQSFHLMPTLTALENVMVPLELAGAAAKEATARRLLERVGLGRRAGHYPAQLSGGEQQRVALARALARDPEVVLADEPTGNLDAATGRQVIDLLLELHRERGTTLVLVTHDPELASRSGRVVELREGLIVADRVRASAGAPA
ncbi:MAG TPA: ABC transporter ATP-binding protein [Thermodesulfobacteriota bacterium]